MRETPTAHSQSQQSEGSACLEVPSHESGEEVSGEALEASECQSLLLRNLPLNYGQQKTMDLIDSRETS